MVRTRGRLRLLVPLLLAASASAALWWRPSAPHLQRTTGPGRDLAPGATPAERSGAPAYVDHQSCLECHPKQRDAWRASHHAQAMAVADAESVRGDFNEATFTHQGVTSRFFKRGDKFFVHTDGPDGKLSDFEVLYTFGVEPLQQYLLALPGGRLQALQIAWDEPRQRWFHLLPGVHAPAGDVLHWTSRYQTANTMCIACHTTGFEKRYDAANDRFDSRWSEPNVSCQACHGPGEHHVEWARQHRTGKESRQSAPYGLTVDLTNVSAQQQVEGCAPCHSRRSELTAQRPPGEPRLDHDLPALLEEGLYHADGQQLGEVYEDGSFRQSKMYQKGVSCAHCHDVHSGLLTQPGNTLCVQCHAPQGNPKFASAAGEYDSPKHHFHESGSAGAACVNCHMPAKAYMQIQPRVDHSIRVPRPDLSIKLGTPNACNQCHDDKTAAWAEDRVAQWYEPARRRETHYGEVFAGVRSGRSEAFPALAMLAGDGRQPAIVRATALATLPADEHFALEQRARATRDPDPEVRAAAADSLASAAPPQRLQALRPLLRDPIRAVRIAAARSLSTLPHEQLDAGTRAAFDAVLHEFVAAQSVASDMPGAHLNLAVVYQNTGRTALAEKHYLRALEIDPDFTPARANLARLYDALSRKADAVRVLEAGLARIPELGDLQYSLGLVLAEDGRLPEAAAALVKAAALLPRHAGVHYNLGLALQQLGERERAEAELRTAQRLDPRDPATAYALAVFYAQAGDAAEALTWAETVLSIAPNDAQARQLIARVRRWTR